MIEHCISSLKLNNEKKSFQVYVTDALKAIAENTTHLVGAKGVVDYGVKFKTRWIDALNPPPPKAPEDNRPCEDIVTDMWNRIKGH